MLIGNIIPKPERRIRKRKQITHVARRCHRCRGNGVAPCQVCGGAGLVARSKDILGRPQFARCGGCFGVKALRCTTCGGIGFE
jgi:hypothetical protein